MTRPMTDMLLRAALCLFALSGCAGAADDAAAPCVGPCLAPGAAPEGAFDFVVVGSGAGGGPLASRLARGGYRVLLLEAGEDVGGRLEYRVPARHALSTEDPAMAWWYFVQHHADPALDAEDSKFTDEGILYPRGSALGGSTAVNAMVTVMPSRQDWDRIAGLTGDASWRASAMDPLVDRVREWLSIEIPAPTLALGDSKITGFLTAAAATEAEDGTPEQALDLPGLAGNLGTLLARDVNAALRTGEATGLFRLPLATRSGERSGPRDLIADTVAQGYPLTVRTGAFVTRVLWSDAAVPTAIGVEYVRQGHVYGANLDRQAVTAAPEQALAGREVILAAGTFNTPQLLMLSGVGPRDVLEAAGIAPRLVNEGVGANLQDRYEAAVVTEFDTPVELVADCALAGDPAADPCQADWQRGEGVYQTSGFIASVLRRSSKALPLADLQVFAVPGDARGYYPGYSADALANKARFTWLLLKAHTANRDGTVRVASADPFQRPRIVFNSFDEADPDGDPDLAALVEGVRFVRRTRDRAEQLMPDDPPREVWPGPEVATDEQVASFVRREAWGHHACCTSRMGRVGEPGAVVDSRFRVIGAERLRVVDASVFPEIPGTFIAMPTYMISEKAAETILADMAGGTP